jgi:hypothetical protein
MVIPPVEVFFSFHSNLLSCSLQNFTDYFAPAVYEKNKTNVRDVYEEGGDDRGRLIVARDGIPRGRGGLPTRPTS